MEHTPWMLHVRDDVPANKVLALLYGQNVSLAIDGAQVTERHLECIAPVPQKAVERIINTIAGICVKNIHALNEASVAFDVYPTDEKISLSETDYKIGQALKLSDPALLIAVRVGHRYSVTFYQDDVFVEKQRESLWKLGIELGPNPSWVASPSILVKRKADSEENSHPVGENI